MPRRAWGVTAGTRVHSIGAMRAAGTVGRPARMPGRPAGSAMLTMRRQIDYCRVAAALCRPGPRRDRTA
jgi:hypothetical protein